jgi:hypothetical protein
MQRVYLININIFYYINLMGFLCGICNLVKRTLLYQIFLVFAWFKWVTMTKSAHELKDRVFQLSTACGFKHPLLDKAFEDPILAFKAFVGLQVGCAAVAILGLPFLGGLAGLLCAVLLAANTIVYEINLPGEGRAIVWKDWQSLITYEGILSIIVIIGILAQVFSCNGDSTSCHTEQAKVRTEDIRANAPGSGKRNKRNLDK